MRADQCLFGYKDGHRLLATSMPLGDDAPTLAQLSDLAPDTVFGASEGYWTGLPVPGIGRYALMRTWPAPEMPRPGCVWTHAVLLDPLVLEELPNLSGLRRLARRPRSPDDLAAYLSPLVLTGERGDPRPSSETTVPDVLRRLVASLYRSTGAATAAGAPGALDDAVFAVWSQQWPRLRRNLRFQTAASRAFQPAPGARLDLVQVIDHAPAARDDGEGNQGWLDAAVADIESGSGPLRDALWRYGRDVRRQRGSFRPLCEIQVIAASGRDDAGMRLLGAITEAFPEREDALTLKQDAIDGALAPFAQPEMLRFVLAEGGERTMPSPSCAGVARLARLWPERPDELLDLAERTVGSDEPVRRSIFETITGAMPTQRFWEVTRPFPRVMEGMVAARPELIASDGVRAIGSATLASLIRLLPEDGAIAGDVIPQLLVRDDANLAEAVMGRFPSMVAIHVVYALNRNPEAVARAWVRTVVGRPDVLLVPAVLGKVRRSSVLYDVAEALDWLGADVVRHGTEPWVAAMAGINGDLPEDRRHTLRVFLVAIALAAGGEDGRRLLEDFFDLVHTQIMKSGLPWKARDILLPVLPHVGWAKEWDLGLRLRLAVAHRYVASGYDPESYAALSQSHRTRELLAEAADRVDGGRTLARAVE